MAEPDLRVLVGVLGGASISGETGQQIIRELKAITSQVSGNNMPRVAVSVDINKTRQIWQQQLQQVANRIQVQAPIKANLLGSSLTTFDTAKLESEGKRYLRLSNTIIDDLKQAYSSLGTVVDVKVFKGLNEDIQHATVSVKTATGELENHRLTLAQLNSEAEKFKGLVETSSTLTDKTTGTGLQQTLNYLTSIETKLANITSAATVNTSKPLLPGMTQFDDYNTRLGEVKARIQEIRSSTTMLSDEHKREINTMVADLKRYAQELQTAAYASSELEAKTFAAQKTQYQSSLAVQIKQWTASGLFGGDFEAAVNKAKALLDSATDSSGLVEYRNQLKLLQNEFKSLNIDRSSWTSLIEGDTLSTNIETARLRIQNLKTTYSSFVSDPKLMSEWQALFDQSQIVTTQKELNNLNAQVKQFEQKLISAGKNSTSVFSRLAQSARSMASWMVFGSIFSAVTRGVRGIYDAVVDLDTQMIELRKVTDETSVAYDQFLDRAYDKAIRLGTSVAGVVEATANFAKLDYSIDEAEELAELAIIYQNVGDEVESVDDATSSIVSTMKAFNIQSKDASSIIDKFNEIGNNFSITSGGIGEALQRSASSLAVANNTLDESIALIVASNNVIQDPDRVGTMWQTVTARIRGAKTELEEAGLETDYMAESTSKLRETVMALTNIDGLGGFDIMQDEETFKSTYDILLGISKVWKGMSDIDRSALLELLAGKRQSNALAAAITNMDTAAKALNTSLNSTGSAYAEHAKWLDSISAKQQQFSAQFQEFANTFLSSDLVKGVISTGTGLLGWLTAITDKLGALPVLLGAIGGIRSLASNAGLFQIDNDKNWGGSGIGITTSFAASKKAAAELAEQLNADVTCLQNFENAVQNGSYATGDFDKIMAGASSQAKTYAATTKGAAGSTMQYKVAQDAAASSTKAMGVSAKAAGIGVRVLNMAMNMLISMGIGLAINAIIAGFDALVNAASKASEKANELALEQREIADAAAEEAQSIDELIEKYKQLRTEEYVDADSRAEVRDIQSQITSLVGDQASNLDLVNGKLDDELKKLKEIQLESAKASQDSYVASYHADRDAADQAVGEDKFLFANGYGYVGSRDNAAYEILKNLKNSYGSPLFQKGGFFNSNLFSMETGTAEERIAQLTEAMEALKNAADYDYTDSDLYAGLSAAVKVYETYTTKLNESTAGLVDSTVLVAALQADISGQTIDSAEAYEKYRQSVIDAALADDALSSGLKDGAISVDDITAAVDDLMATNFPDWYNQAKESVTTSTGASKAVQQYKDIGEALEAVKKAQDAYNSVKEDIENSSDGNISLDTLISLVDTYSDLTTVVSDYLAGTASVSDILDVLAGKFNDAADAAGYYQEKLSELEEASELKITVDSLSSYEDAYASLSDTLGEFIENGIVSAETIAGLMETFGDTEALREFVSVLGQEGVTADQVKEALNSLGEEYLSNSEILDQLTEENADLIAATLEAHGVMNAQEVVANRLAAQQLEVQYATELASKATWDETAAFLEDVGATEDAINALYALRVEEYNAALAATDFTDATADEIGSLVNLASAAGVAAEKITLLKMIQTASQGWSVAKASGMLASDYEWLSDLSYDQIQDMFKVDLDGYDIVFKANVTPALSSSSSSSSSSDPWKEEFEAYYNAHKHAVAMEQETLADFYAWLDGQDGYKKYFANNEKYLDEFYKYSEEVFEGLRELADDVITDSEHQIYLWENQGGHETDIVQKYRDLQAQVHETAESIRNSMRNAGWSELEIENSEIIQSLQKQWWSFEDSIKDVFDSISDTISDYLNDIEHYISLLEHEAGDTGSNNSAILANYAGLKAYVLQTIDDVTAKMKDLGYTQTEIANSGVIQELQEKLWDYEDSINDILDTLNDDLYDSLKSLLDLTIEMIRREQEDEKDALSDLIDKYKEIVNFRKEMLQLDERERTYQENVSEQSSTISRLQARIDALALDDSRTAAIERASLMKELEEAQERLNELQREHAIDCTEDQLDAEVDAYEDAQNEKIQAIEDFLNNNEALNQAALARLDNMNEALWNDLLSYALHYTSTTRDELEDMWNSALSAAQNYGSYVDAMSAAKSGSYYTDSGYGSSSSAVSGPSSTLLLVEDLIAKMKVNSASWFSGNQTALANENAGYASQISSLIGEKVVRGNDGVWYIGSVGGAKLYDDYKKYCYHTGGVVGNVPTLKQNEVLSLLNKGELVLNMSQQGNLASMFDQFKRLDAMQEALTAFRSGAFTTATAAGPTFYIDAPISVDGTLPEKQIMKIFKKHSRDIANEVFAKIP